MQKVPPQPTPKVVPDKLPGAADQKIAELEKKIREVEAQAAELKDRHLRTYADFDNYKKRVAKDREELIQATTERLLRELLEVKDHLELALDHSRDAADVKPLHDGVTLTLKQMDQFLEKCGVRELTSLGEKFDPAFHEAIQEEESQACQPGSVAREYQKGYLYQGRLLRAARVAIAKEPKS